MRERFFTPRVRFRTYEKLHAWLHDKSVAYADMIGETKPATAK